MTSVFETCMEQTVGTVITIMTDACETVFCSTFGAPMYQPIIDAICSTLYTGK